MNKVKIEVIRTTLEKDLAKEYGIKNLGPCPLHQIGQIYYSDHSKPEGFCDEAWKAIYQYVFTLAHGGKGDWYFSDWIIKDGIAIVCCQDGLRPTIFKLTRMDEPYSTREASSPSLKV